MRVYLDIDTENIHRHRHIHTALTIMTQTRSVKGKELGMAVALWSRGSIEADALSVYVLVPLRESSVSTRVWRVNGMANVPAGLDVVQAMVSAPAGRPAWLRRRLLVRLRRCDSARVPRTCMQVQKLTHKGACAPTALLLQVASIWNWVGINYDSNPTSVPTPGRFVLPPFVGP